jgi:hypothetical protein
MRLNPSGLITITGLFLLSGIAFSTQAGIAQAPPKTAPIVQKPILQNPKLPIVNTAFLIVPQQSVGKINKQTNRQQLATIFGKKNVEDFTERGPEGQGNVPATRVTIDGIHSLDVLWQDDTRQKISGIEIYDSRWHTADGLTVNTPIAALQKKFGKFSFYGFSWDYGGLVNTGNAKLDQYRQKTGISFTLDVSGALCQKFSDDCHAVSGDSTFASDNPHLVPLKAHISILHVRLSPITETGG